MKHKEPTVKVKTVGVPVSDSIKYRLISDQMINLTKAKAFELLEMDTFSGDRPVRQAWVQHLYDEWLGGRFLWHQAMVAEGYIMEQDPVTGARRPHLYRLNGQHTCWMRVNIPTDKEPRTACKVRHLMYECINMDGLRELYAVIDRNASRTNAHITKVLLCDATPCSAVPMSYLNALIAGMKLWLWEGSTERNMKGSPQEMAALINGKYSELFRIVGQYFQIKYTEWPPIKRAGIIAALFATFEKVGGLAPDFWDKVCSGLGLDSKTDPRYQLRQFSSQHTQNRTVTGSLAAEDQYRICINMWNRWRKKESVNVVRTTDTRMKPV
jgi:hypothetical protein